MNETLSTSACLLGRFGPFGPFKPGELGLANGVLTFTLRKPAEQGAVFSAPVYAVKVRSPLLYFGFGLQLVVGRTRYRIWFLPLESAAGDRVWSSDGEETILWGNKVDLDQLSPARATTRMWRDALSKANA